jgi:hypothetical protein
MIVSLRRDGLYELLQPISNRAQVFEWDDEIGGILMAQKNQRHDPLSDGENCIENNGQISLEKLGYMKSPTWKICLSGPRLLHGVYKCQIRP